MTIWFTADLHIGHGRVAEMRATVNMITQLDPMHIQGREPNEKHCAAWHDKWLAYHWDCNVASDDVVWVLGDVSAGSNLAQRRALEWIQNRPGTKHLIVGNHDGCHPMHRDAHKWQRIYLEAFESVQVFARRYVPLPDGSKQEVVLSHFPYNGDHTRQERHTQWRLRDEGCPVLHGHTHSSERVSYSRPEMTAQVHVGVEAWQGRPVSLSDVGELLV